MAKFREIIEYEQIEFTVLGTYSKGKMANSYHDEPTHDEYEIEEILHKGEDLQYVISDACRISIDEKLLEKLFNY